MVRFAFCLAVVCPGFVKVSFNGTCKTSAHDAPLPVFRQGLSKEPGTRTKAWEKVLSRGLSGRNRDGKERKNMKRAKQWMGWVAAVTVAGSAVAAEITLEQAETAVGNWIARGGAFGKLAGQAEVAGETFVDSDTGAKMHVVRVPGKGFAVTSADDGIEPIILFSDGDGAFVAEEGNPLWDLLRWDLAAREKALEEEEGKGSLERKGARSGGNAAAAREKWRALLGGGAATACRQRGSPWVLVEMDGSLAGNEVEPERGGRRCRLQHVHSRQDRGGDDSLRQGRSSRAGGMGRGCTGHERTGPLSRGVRSRGGGAGDEALEMSEVGQGEDRGLLRGRRQNEPGLLGEPICGRFRRTGTAQFVQVVGHGGG